MTNQELNRDIKRLGKQFDTEKTEKQLQDFEKEFKRLYYADNSFKALNKDSILIMLRTNLRYRFIALHSFGLNIEL